MIRRLTPVILFLLWSCFGCDEDGRLQVADDDVGLDAETEADTDGDLPNEAVSDAVEDISEIHEIDEVLTVTIEGETQMVVALVRVRVEWRG